MEIHHSIENFPNFNHPIITIGSYDGLHIGHRKIIDKIAQLSRKEAVDSVVITFNPHPRQVIYPQENNLELLNSVDEKVALFQQLGIDHLVLYPFTAKFAEMSPQEYIEDFIVKNFDPSLIVIGYDHKFGKGRAGNIDTLREFSEKHTYEVLEIPAQEWNDISVSSTKIRTALQNGDVTTANSYLCRPYPMRGKVIHGEKRGNELGFPTANITLDNPLKLVPLDGIYAVRVTIEEKQYEGMLYIGTKPTYDHGSKSIEVNIFDFQDNIYNEYIWIDFISFIRDDAKFANSDLLIEQLQKDKLAAEKLLNE